MGGGWPSGELVSKLVRRLAEVECGELVLLGGPHQGRLVQVLGQDRGKTVCEFKEHPHSNSSIGPVFIDNNTLAFLNLGALTDWKDGYVLQPLPKAFEKEIALQRNITMNHMTGPPSKVAEWWDERSE